MNVAALDRLAEAALRANWRAGTRRGVPYAFTIPSAPRYRHMWHWDSCFHAIAWCRHDPARGREELRTVLRSGDADGFLPHTVFWDRPAGWRRAPFYATASLWGSWRTETIDPPLLPVAWERVAAASTADDPGFATEALPRLAAHLDWLERERSLAGDGLLTIVLPDESGLDDSPAYDAVFGPHVHHLPGYFRLVHRWRALGWHVQEIARSSDHHCVDVLVTTAYAMSLHAMSRLDVERADGWAARAARVEAALCDQCLDERTGLFLHLAGRDRTPVPVSTWAALAPLALPGIPEDVRRRLVEEHLLDPRRYGGVVGVPSVSMEEPTFTPGFDRWRTWRGPSWVNTAWWLVPGLRELGYGVPADAIVGGLAEAAARGGLREYYDPRDGRGLGARGFGWSSLIAGLAAQCGAADPAVFLGG